MKGEKEMAKNKKTKFITKDILKSSIIGSFQKLDPRYMIKNRTRSERLVFEAESEDTGAKSGYVCRRNWMFHHVITDFCTNLIWWQ